MRPFLLFLVTCFFCFFVGCSCEPSEDVTLFFGDAQTQKPMSGVSVEEYRDYSWYEKWPFGPRWIDAIECGKTIVSDKEGKVSFPKSDFDHYRVRLDECPYPLRVTIKINQQIIYPRLRREPNPYRKRINLYFFLSPREGRYVFQDSAGYFCE
jgi:hypothetical protein